MADDFSWVKRLDRIILGGLWWVFSMAIILILPFLRPWWWVFMPIFLSIELKKLYLWWVQWDFNYANKKWVVLRIITPKEVITPLKAMEDVFTVIWPTLYSPPSWRERWCEGSLPTMGEWMSFEIASIEGRIHFYMRVTTSQRGAIEAALYAHYPELEIHEVSDYTKDVPQNIPNQEWDTYGEDFVTSKAAPYPIKTYEKFFEPQGEKLVEEKRFDPISSLLEAMSKLGTGEQFWLQFILMAHFDDEYPAYKKEANHIISKLTKRPEKKKATFGDELAVMARNLTFGPVKEGSGEKATYKWVEATKSESGDDREMVLTPGEREALTEIENKLKKPAFRTVIRGVYTAKRENWNGNHKTLTRSYFSHFQTLNLNYIKFTSATRPKTQYFMRKRIPLMRARRMLINYVLRLTPFFPDRMRESSILSTEEMATIFHFPLKVTGMVFPTMARVESKKSGPPPNLPT